MWATKDFAEAALMTATSNPAGGASKPTAAPRSEMPQIARLAVWLIVLLWLAAFAKVGLSWWGQPKLAVQPPKGGAMAFTLNSGSFHNGDVIPRDLTCDGSDASPALSWAGAPAGTKSFAMIVDDPDAPGGIFTHWVIYDIPGDAAKLPQGMAKTDEASGARQGRNSFGKIGYGGPCPPPGKPHRYIFKLYALRKPLNLKPGASKQELEHAMSGDVLGTAELMGTYGRSKS